MKDGNSTQYIGSKTLSIPGIVTGYVNNGEGTVSITSFNSIVIRFLKNTASDVDYSNGNYSITYSYLQNNS
jgi:hypothetical protein